MFDCINTVKEDCLGETPNTSLLRSNETYPKVAYVMMYSDKGGLPILFGGVFESEYDAQQYCIDHSTSSKNFYYYVGSFQPPSQESLEKPRVSLLKGGTGPNYPNYAYPTATRHDPNTYWDPQPPYVFANEKDASNYVASHSNSNSTLQYSIQNWVPANTYSYAIHGFVGHMFKRPNNPSLSPLHSVAPAEVIYR